MSKQTSTTRTRPHINRVALVFDLDDTLAPDTYKGFLADLGLDPESFDREQADSRERDGWDPIPARFYALLEASRGRVAGETITRERLTDYGKRVEPFEGVPEMFDLVREWARRLDPEIEVEFYVLSSGLAGIIRATSIAREFDGGLGCDFHFDDEGGVEFVRSLVSHTEKPHYLHLVEKGPERWAKAKPYELFRHVPEEEVHVPLSQVVYVGDGSSDVPRFALLSSAHGVAIGVNKEGTDVIWGGDGQVAERERIANIAPADYRRGSELLESILLAVDGIVARIRLAALYEGE